MGTRYDAAEPAAQISVEQHDSVLIARIDGGDLGTFSLSLADALDQLVEQAEQDPKVRSVVLTGTHPSRFISHADIKWLQEGGAESPSVGLRAASGIAKAAVLGRVRELTPAVRRTPLWGAVQLDRLHNTLLQMNRSSVVYVAALNGSALGFGAELAWACDVRVMADGDDFFIGQPEVLLGFNPGGGGTQRLARLIGGHRSLMAMLEGRPLHGPEALRIGAIDELVPQEQVMDRAVALGNSLGSRPPLATAAIKRAVYIGGTMSLPDGLEFERKEFLAVLHTREAQELMKAYRRDTLQHNELPFYEPSSYDAALSAGRYVENGHEEAP
ncbi:enoyl-CoA hydratase/isomerase family protein [Streptomyces chartreusis]|uniref:enoyl-CoA hydratase/isomerase family protein n=1 Tax=Streptomyces chartreusis TaxID=1969 RepID=UPI0033E1780A